MKSKTENKIVFKKRGSRGYTLIELLFYIAIFSLISLLVIDAMLTMARSFKETSIYAELSQGGAIMERMSREIRQANSINSISSTSLKLNTKDTGGADKTVEFRLSGTDIEFYENDTLSGDLNSPNIVVTALSFTEITTVEGKTVKAALSIRSSHDKLSRVHDFYNTIVLRGDY